ncbi:hypothetical protein [Mixta intestinalis]|jgi:hypothetical protein|uniref:Uncharacterized protein n=1 Tax=Mixta intestinalis TaxID=1615494 RepID=A0A6P1Q4Z3_9GAMM|nr:hypothetical protein [Mixta intestinalis]QHM73462.1 hypothetical protein C7M51_03809 [Mixta intestinalis]
MTLPKYLLSSLFCLFLGFHGSSQAETYGLPKINEQQLVLNDQGQIALEIMAGKIISQTRPDFSGYVRLIWTGDNWSSTAKQLRNMLISKGLSPERVMLSQESGGYRSQNVMGVQVLIQRFTLRLPECTYAMQNYRFRLRDEQGCALNNTLNSSIISSYPYNF